MALLAVLAGASAGSLHAQAAPQPTVGVDVSVSQVLVDAEGATTPVSYTPTRFRLERVHDASGWRTVLTYPATPGHLADKASTHPLDGARIEYADGAPGPRVYDKAGRLDTRLSPEAPGTGLPPFDGAARWIEALRSDPDGRRARLEMLARTYGPPRDRVRNLERYVSNSGDIVDEVLADPETGVVREISRIRGGRLEQRTAFEYEPLPGGALFRHTIRSETPLDGQQRGRSIVTVRLSNLTIGGGR